MSSQNGGCQHVFSDNFIKNAFILPWSAVCNHGFTRTTGLITLFSVMQWRCQWSAFCGWPSHSMCSHPHFDRLAQSRFRKKLSPSSLIKGSCGEQISRKTVSRERGPRNYGDFAKNHALGRQVHEISGMGGQKMGSDMQLIYPITRYTRPWYIGSTLYHVCWCTGDFRSQSISRHWHWPPNRNTPFLASEELSSDVMLPNWPVVTTWTRELLSMTALGIDPNFLNLTM